MAGEKAFPVSWEEFHRDARALAWRLADAGPFAAIVCITRGGLVPAAIVSRELEIRIIETVCVASYHDYKNQGEIAVLKTIAEAVTRAEGEGGAGVRSSTTSSTPAAPPRSSGRCCRRRTSPLSTRSRRGGRSSTPSSPRCRRTPGSTSPGTWAIRSSRRSRAARQDSASRYSRLQGEGLATDTIAAILMPNAASLGSTVTWTLHAPWKLNGALTTTMWAA